MGDDQESQKPILPRDIFRNKLTFNIHETSTFRLFWVISGLSLGLGYIAGKKVIPTPSGIQLFLSVFFAVISFEIMFTLLLIYIYHKRERLDVTSLVQQMLELKPGTDIQRWDEIAHRMNLTLYEECFWNTSYYFFDGEHARSFFSRRVLRRYFKGNFDDITDADKIQSACDYLQSLSDQFEMSLKDDLSQLPLSAELPRDTQKSFFFFFRRLSTSQLLSLGSLQNMAFYMLFRAFLGSRVSFAYYLSGQFLTWVDFCQSMSTIYPKLGIIQLINFLAIITKANPKEELDNWDRIAMFMNRYVTEENGGYSKNIFFDGKQCLNFYKTYFEQLSVDNYKNNFIDLKEIAESVKSKID